MKTFEELLEQQLKLEEVSGVHFFSFPGIQYVLSLLSIITVH